MDHDRPHDHYVCHGDWLRRSGRAGLIDEIADQFERAEPSCRCAQGVEDGAVQPAVGRQGVAAA